MPMILHEQFAELNTHPIFIYKMFELIKRNNPVSG